MKKLAAMAELPLSPSDSPGKAANETQAAGVGILLQIMMLVLAFVLGHVLRRHKFYYLHEASASLLIGLIVGGLANISNTEENIRKWFNFHEEFFFLLLLPPIIFQSGFSLQPKPFFSNFGAIITFAILGTFISSMVTGILVYLGGIFLLMFRLPFQECMMFGALISATDPVTILAIFQELGCDTNLYALVFGESVLNDAVAISLYRTMLSVRQHAATNQSMLTAVWRFIETFFGSMSTGAAVALSSALLFKYAGLGIDNLQNLECCLFVLFPYLSYMLAEGLGLSGIVAILFCGIVMKHYTFSNLSEKSQTFTAGFFELISSLAETFVFIYMGLDIATEQQSWSHVGFIFFSILFIGVARAANVFPCAYFINFVRPESRKIPMKHQKALWYSGLRGAMAFALALQSIHELPDGHGEIIFTATTAIVVLTVLLIGGSTATMLEALEVTGDSQVVLFGESSDEESDYRAPDEASTSSSGQKLKMKLKELRKSTASFTAIDKNFLTPFFTAHNGDVHEHRTSRGNEAHHSAREILRTSNDRGSSTSSPLLQSTAPNGRDHRVESNDGRSRWLSPGNYLHNDK